MKWFKHMSDMSEDPRIKRVVRKHGGMAYAVYNYILERVARRLDGDSPAPDLEETAEDIAEFLRYDKVKVEEIVGTCIAEGLFEQDEATGRVLCRKMISYLEKSQTRNSEIRKMIDSFNGASQTVSDNPGASQTVSDNLRQSQTVSDNLDNVEIRLREEKRIEENRGEKREEQKRTANTEHEPTGLPMNATRYQTLLADYGKNTVEHYIQRVYDWAAGKGKLDEIKCAASRAKTFMDRDGVQKRRKDDGPAIDVRQLGGYAG